MTTALAAPPATDAAVADLVLVRMTPPSKNPVGPKAVETDVGKLLGFDFSAAHFDDLRNELASAGFLTKGKRNTCPHRRRPRTGAAVPGRRRAPAADELVNRDRQVPVPEAAGLSADAAAKLDNGDKLAAFILKRKYGLRRGRFDGEPGA